MRSNQSFLETGTFLSSILIVASILFAACSGLPSNSTPTLTPSLSISEEEYAVYRALIEARYIQRETQLLVIRDHTGVEMGDMNDRMGYLIHNFPDLSAEMITDFKLKNQLPCILENHFNLSIPTRLLNDDEFQQIFKNQDGWEQFYAQFPSSQGIMTLSRVGFNAKMNMALVYVGNQSHWLAGAGYYLFLAKENGSWKVIAEDMAWIS